MVLQKPVRTVAKGKIRKNLMSTDSDVEEKPLAGPREAIALEVLHTMFMKKLAQKSNFVAFQNKKTYVDKNILQNGIDITMDDCFGQDVDADTDSDVSN